MSKQQETKPLKPVKTGDIYQLGDHRLYCGSATDVPSALFTEKVRAVITDPPYGVAYVENKAHFKETIGAKLAKPQMICGDQLQSDEEYAQFTKDWLEQVKPHLDKYNTAYIFNTDLMICALRAGMKVAGWYYSQMIIWIKNTIVVGRKDYLQQHELIAYGWQGRHKQERSKSSSVILYPKPHRSALHSAMKPVGLMRKLLLNSTRIGDIIYDPFGGSGSTLIACEHTKRKCLMVEMDPGYCQRIIKRWEILTNQSAVKE